MEDDTEGETGSGSAKADVGGKALHQRKGARMSVGVRSYPAGVTAPKILLSVDTGSDGDGLSVSDCMPVCSSDVEEESLIPMQKRSEVEGLLADLKALGLDPFFGESVGIPGAVSRSFLLFRSKVTQMNKLSKQSTPMVANGNVADKTRKLFSNHNAERRYRNAVGVSTEAEPVKLNPLSLPASEEPRKRVEEDVGKKAASLERAEEHDMVAKQLKWKKQQLKPKKKQMKPKKKKQVKRKKIMVNCDAKRSVIDAMHAATKSVPEEVQMYSATFSNWPKQLKRKRNQPKRKPLANYYAKQVVIDVATESAPDEVQMLPAPLSEEANYYAKQVVIDGVTTKSAPDDVQILSVPSSEEKQLKRKKTHLANSAAKLAVIEDLLPATKAVPNPNLVQTFSEEARKDVEEVIVQKPAAARETRVSEKSKKTEEPADVASEQAFEDGFGLYTTPKPEADQTSPFPIVSEALPKNITEGRVCKKRARWEMEVENMVAKKAKEVARMKALKIVARMKALKIVARMKALKIVGLKHQTNEPPRKVCVLLDDPPAMTRVEPQLEKIAVAPKSSPTPRELKIAAALAAAMNVKSPVEVTRPEQLVSSGMKSVSAEEPREVAIPVGLASIMKSVSAEAPTEVVIPERRVPTVKVPERCHPAVIAGSPRKTMKPSRLTLSRQEKEADWRPTYLILRFPPGSTLPSVPFLNARLARFGPLVPSEYCVTWETRTCQVLFRRRSDAAAACKYISSSEGAGRMFGSVKLACGLVPGFEEEMPPTPPQLKSCLKKPKEVDDEQRRCRSDLRVKFVLEDGCTTAERGC